MWLKILPCQKIAQCNWIEVDSNEFHVVHFSSYLTLWHFPQLNHTFCKHFGSDSSFLCKWRFCLAHLFVQAFHLLDYKIRSRKKINRWKDKDKFSVFTLYWDLTPYTHHTPANFDTHTKIMKRGFIHLLLRPKYFTRQFSTHELPGSQRRELTSEEM